MMRVRCSLLVLVAPLALLAACGGDDGGDASGDAGGSGGAGVATTAVAAVAATDTAPGATGTDTATSVAAGPEMSGLQVLDTVDITFDTPAGLAGTVSRSGLAAADPMSLDVYCAGSTGFFELRYTPTAPGEVPVAFFTITAEIDGPGTYPAGVTLSAPDVPAGGMPFTEVTGADGELTVTGDLTGSFRVDDGFGNDITGSYTCTRAAAP